MFWFWQASPRCPPPTQTACWENSAATSVGPNVLDYVKSKDLGGNSSSKYLFSLCVRSHDDSSRRKCAGAVLLVGGDIRPAGVSVPVHRERQPGDHTLLLHLTRRQQLAGVFSDLCWVVRSCSAKCPNFRNLSAYRTRTAHVWSNTESHTVTGEENHIDHPITLQHHAGKS